MNFCTRLHLLFCGVSKSDLEKELSTCAIRQRRELMDGSGHYYIYIIDVCTN